MVVLKLDLPPYLSIGAVFVRQIIEKSRLVLQTGIDLVCGPEGELCACYHNGWELLNGEDSTVYDGDFLVCWLDAEPQETVSSHTVETSQLSPVITVTDPTGEGCASLPRYWRTHFKRQLE